MAPRARKILVPPPPPEYETFVVYRIYRVSPDGLLKRPMEGRYGLDTYQFQDHPTQVLAQEAYDRNEFAHGEHVILPVMTKRSK